MSHDKLVQVFYVVDLLLCVPGLWVAGNLFAGAVTGHGVVFRIGWTYCILGLVWMAAIILRVTGVLHP